MIEFCKRYNNIVSFVSQPVIPVGRGNVSQMASNINLLKKYYEVRNMGGHVSLSLLLGHAYDIPELAQYITKHGREEERFFCSAARSRLHIDEENKVYPCHFLAYPEFLLGNLNDNNLDQIWKNSSSKYVRNLSKKDGECMSCKLSKHCTKKGLCTSYLNGGINKQPVNCFVDLKS